MESDGKLTLALDFVCNHCDNVYKILEGSTRIMNNLSDDWD